MHRSRDYCCHPACEAFEPGGKRPVFVLRSELTSAVEVYRNGFRHGWWSALLANEEEPPAQLTRRSRQFLDVHSACETPRIPYQLRKTRQELAFEECCYPTPPQDRDP